MVIYYQEKQQMWTYNLRFEEKKAFQKIPNFLILKF